MREAFERDGYCGPVKVLERAACRRVLKELRNHKLPPSPDWNKALAVSAMPAFRIAVLPAILERVRDLIGDDIMLWGSHLVIRRSGRVHHWHNDVETSVPQGKTVSVWIGLENTSRDSSLQLISRSHHFRESIQEARQKSALSRTEASTEEVLSLAQARDAQSMLAVPEMENGDALFFDGWLWHASHNTGSMTRTALLLQYATPDTPIRIPDQNDYEWPFRTLASPKPPCMMISGSDHFNINRIVPPPLSADADAQFTLSTRIYNIPLPLTPDEGKDWKPFHIFRGATPNLQHITCHVSALTPGSTPHPPHHHREEEILILLSGSADVTLPDLAKEGRETTVRLVPGDFVYYPAWFYHTITATGNTPANYLMLKWYNRNDHPETSRLAYGKYAIDDYQPPVNTEKKFAPLKIFQGRTDCLHTLQCHTSSVLPGGGYTMHSDAHDVAILTWRGTIQSVGERIAPMSMVFFPAGEKHDMHNPASEKAEYLVFEFHGNHPPPPRAKKKKRPLWQKLRDPQSWIDKYNALKSRLKG